MLQNIKKRNQGFTIIEVLIVLAIAGLILLVIFLAVPALQRNSRNTQRKSDASHLAGVISEWVSNNAGTTPSAFGSAAGQIDVSAEKFAIITVPTAIATLPGTLPGVPAADTVLVYTSATCTGNIPTPTSSTRAIAIWYGIEGATKSSCITAS